MVLPTTLPDSPAFPLPSAISWTSSLFSRTAPGCSLHPVNRPRARCLPNFLHHRKQQRFEPSARALFADGRLPERSATVFSSDLPTWAEFLAERYEPPSNPVFDGNLELLQSGEISWEPATAMARPWQSWLKTSFEILNRRASDVPVCEKILSAMLWRSRSDGKARCIRIVSEARLPCHAVRWNRQNNPASVVLLVHPSLLFEVEREIRHLHPSGTPGELFGASWPFWRRILLLLAYPERPRDRFMERISHTLETSVLSLFLLFKDQKESNRLAPNRAGEHFLAVEARIATHSLGASVAAHALPQLLENLSFLHHPKITIPDLRPGSIVVRDHLDALYLRLSIADLMPDPPEWMRGLASPSGTRSVKHLPPIPPLGTCGLLDDEDREAWEKLCRPMFEMGFYLLGQLGMGQFGRVYRACNFGRPNLLPFVAIKVDRIRKKAKKEAIQAAETIMDTARTLAFSPHVIRVFDAGKIRKKNWTFHVLQLVDGDTLDNLIGTTGLEHASLLRPETHHSSEAQVRTKIFKAVQGSASETWRRSRSSSQFAYPPSLLQTLHLMTSKSLWIEEIHRLGFAVNDLKNGNIMLNQRGQFKGIDLDSYAPAASALDRLPDFFFLAISTFHLVTHLCKDPGKANRSTMTRLLAEPEAMRTYFRTYWPWPNPPEQNDLVAEIRETLVRYIDACRDGSFAHDLAAFHDTVDRIIDLKRELANEDLVLE